MIHYQHRFTQSMKDWFLLLDMNEWIRSLQNGSRFDASGFYFAEEADWLAFKLTFNV